MSIRIVSLPETEIVGKEGLCTRERNVVPELWAEANAHFGEVAEIAKKAPDGTLAGYWGAMSDKAMRFEPWEDGFTKGLYLAGVEVTEGAQAPEGWTKWVLPARRYLVAEVDPGRYGEVFRETLERTLPENGLALSGAVCDHTEPATGKNELYFPVVKAL